MKFQLSIEADTAQELSDAITLAGMWIDSGTLPEWGEVRIGDNVHMPAGKSKLALIRVE